MTTPSRDAYSSMLRKGTEWDEVRSDILPALIGILSTRFHEHSVEVGSLFKDALPDGTTPKSFSVGFWKKEDQQIQGTFLHEDKREARGWSVLLRHKFGCKWYLQARLGTARKAVDCSSLVNKAVCFPPSKQKPTDGKRLMEAQKKIRELLAANSTTIPSPQRNTVTPASSERMTRSESIVSDLSNSKNSYREFSKMSPTGQEMVFKRLMTRRAVECDDEDDNATKDDALSLLTFFDADTFSQQAFINRVLKSPAVQSSGSLFPRNKGGFETCLPRTKPTSHP